MVVILEIEEVVQDGGEVALVLVAVLWVAGLPVTVEPLGHGQVHLELARLNFTLVKEDAGADNVGIQEVVAGNPGHSVEHRLLPHLRKMLLAGGGPLPPPWVFKTRRVGGGSQRVSRYRIGEQRRLGKQMTQTE